MSTPVTTRGPQTAADWTALNPTLDQFEIGIEVNPATGAYEKAKIGDGRTAWTSLGYWNPSGSTGDVTALRFDGTAHNINHGIFWEEDRKYGSFFWDMLIRPMANSAGYVISAGYGPQHNLLFGITSDDSTAQFTGNINNTSDAIQSFTSRNGRFRVGDWMHVAVIWDQTTIYVYVNGIFEGATTYAANYRSTPNPYDGGLFVGGSDHSNGIFDLAWIRGFEGPLPFNPTALFSAPFVTTKFPLAAFSVSGDAKMNAVFLADYTRGGGVIADDSNGLPNGISQVETNTVVAAGGITGNGNAKCVVTANGMPNSPKTVTFAVTTATHTTAALIAAAARAALFADADVSAFMRIDGSGADLSVSPWIPQANDATMNLTIENDTCTGIADDTTSVHTTAGYAGQMVKHPGVANSGATAGGFYDPAQPWLIQADTDSPQRVAATIAKPSATVSVTIPPTAKIYDSFSNKELSPFWDSTPGLGSTEGGTLGILPWTGSSTYWVSYGQVTPSTTYGGIALVDVGTADMDVRITRDAVSYAHVYLSYTDANNFLHAQFYGDSGGGNEYMQVDQNLAGVTTAVIAFGVVTGSSVDIKVTRSGTTVNLYEGEVLKATGTCSGSLTGTKAGFALNSFNRTKIETFSVY